MSFSITREYIYFAKWCTGNLCVGPSMDSQIIYSLFSECIKASEILGIDKEFSASLKELRDRLPKPAIGKCAQI